MIAEASLHAELPFINRTVRVATNRDYFISPHPQINPAASPTVWTDCFSLASRTLVILANQSSCGTTHHAFTARLAFRFPDRLVLKGADFSLIAAKSKVNRANPINFFTAPHADAAENALIWVSDEERVGVVNGKVPYGSLETLQTALFNANIDSNILEFAVRVPGALKALGIMICD